MVMAMTHLRGSALGIALFALLLGALPQMAVASTSTLNDELLAIDQQLLQARNELLVVAEQMRDAKQVVAEKHNEVADLEAASALDASALATGHLRHARQRLALAKMGVDTTAARFERIQRKMEDLAAERIQLLSSRDNQAESLAPATAVPLLNLADGGSEAAAPVLDVEGQLTDPAAVQSALQRLEQYLVTAEAPKKVATNAKMFGSSIEGEVALQALGGNQFFSRFIAQRRHSKIVAGARLGSFIRTSVDLKFSADEIGSEFILILDVNSAAEPSAIVFDSALIPTKDTVAVSQRL